MSYTRSITSLLATLLMLSLCLPAMAGEDDTVVTDSLSATEKPAPLDEQAVLSQSDSLATDTTKQEANKTYQTRYYRVQGGRLLNRANPSRSLLEEAVIEADSTRGAIVALSDTLTRRERKAILRAQNPKPPFISLKDSMPISRVSALSIPLPGFSQIYNKQYYKLPVLYGTMVTAGLLYSSQKKKYQDYKKQYEALIADFEYTHAEVDPVQEKMIRHNTYRHLLLSGMIATYIYFIGDGALNYKYSITPVKKATTLSTICPGAGQIYNKSFWKVPIILGGFATMGYMIDFNNRGYKRFQKAYNYMTDGDENTVDEFKGRYDSEALRNWRNNYRRNRDLCIIATVGVYLLNIIDAHVDAHLRDYDVSDDLSSISIHPTIQDCYTQTSGTRQSYGISLCYTF